MFFSYIGPIKGKAHKTVVFRNLTDYDAVLHELRHEMIVE